ncbi:glycosyltransferase [Acidicapsa ligni]|uniref:glycosyltransferase n=1 Tax=Acidicapsa ligni TaxID=542300 RepID=UPI0021DF455F|nr:glycosyltransferase family 2 protein [Acidicapsa ligni]
MKVVPWHIGVLVPARNEETLLPRCISSLLAARERLPHNVTCDIVVAIDSSTDRSREIAEALLGRNGTVVVVNARAVGTARAVAAKVALERYAGSLKHCWLANTDADCEVPTHWLADHLGIARQGVDAVAGIVDVDSFAEHDALVPERFRLSYQIHADGTHPHVHGANIGVRADAYLLSGGWPAIESAEDHGLWRRLRDSGHKPLSASKLRVTTSGRKIGRAPHGFADALAAHNGTPV